MEIIKKIFYMTKKKNKKAMFFTILAVTLLTFFLLMYSLYSETRRDDSINNRINTMNNLGI